MNVKGAASESSEGNKERIIGHLKKGNPGYIVAERLAELVYS